MKRFYFAAAVAAMAFASCSTEKESAQPVPDEVAIHFATVNALDVITRADPIDYAANFKVFITGGVTAAAKLVKYSAIPQPSWDFENSEKITVDRTGGDMVAWAPETLDMTTATSSAVTYDMTSQQYAEAQDLIYEKQTVAAPDADNIAIVMKHAYARLTFKVEKGTGYEGDVTLSKVDINSGIKASGILNMLTGDITNDVQLATPISLATDFSALVVPMGTAPSISVTCTIDGKVYTKTNIADAVNMATLEAGTEYEITLKVVKQELGISSVKQIDWTKKSVAGGDIY